MLLPTRPVIGQLSFLNDHMNEHMKDHISKYLSSWAEPEAQIGAVLADNNLHYTNSLVIPAFRESADQFRSVWRKIDCSTARLLVIGVLNANVEDEPETRLLFEQLRADASGIPLQGQGFTLLTFGEGSSGENSPDILLIDRFSTGRLIDRKQGVGLARKLVWI